jgi:hypothetical protein
MAQPQQNISLTAPAFQGVNTEDSPLSQDPTFAARANNAVIDESGRLGARKGFFDYVNTYDLSNLTAPGSSVAQDITIRAMGQGEGLDAVCVLEIDWKDAGDVVLQTDYVPAIVGASTITACSYDDATAATAGNAQLATAQIVTFSNPIGDYYYLFSDGNPALEVDASTAVAYHLFDATNGSVIKPQDDTGTLAAELDGDVACAAYGRLWVSGVGNNYNRIYYSNLTNPWQWYDGKAVPTNSLNTGGVIDVSEYWPNGRDKIQAIVAHNNGLFVFGRNSILVYGNPQGDPAAIGGIFLQDTIEGMGLVSREGIALTGNDVLFVDDTGVRSLGRSIQEQSVPVGDLTANVRSDISNKIATTSDKGTISLAFWPGEGLTVCNFAADRFAYVMDMRKPSSSGGMRITTWSEVIFDRSVHMEVGNTESVLLGGNVGKGVLKYTAYVDSGVLPYQFAYVSNPLSLGDSTREKFPKRMDISVLSQTNATEAVARWGFNDDLTYAKGITTEAQEAEFYGAATFGVSTFGQPNASVKRYRIHTKGSGSLVTLGVDATINGGVFSLQELNLQLLLGRIY